MISLKIAQGLGLTISPRLQIAPNELIQVRADIRFLSLADIQPRYRTRRRQLYLGPIRFGRHTKNQVSLKRKSSFRQSLSGVRLAFSQMNRGIYDFFTRPRGIRSMSELTNPIGTISSQLMRWARQAPHRAHGFLSAERCNLSRDLARRLCAIYWETRTPRGS